MKSIFLLGLTLLSIAVSPANDTQSVILWSISTLISNEIVLNLSSILFSQAVNLLTWSTEKFRQDCTEPTAQVFVTSPKVVRSFSALESKPSLIAIPLQFLSRQTPQPAMEKATEAVAHQDQVPPLQAQPVHRQAPLLTPTLWLTQMVPPPLTTLLSTSLISELLPLELLLVSSTTLTPSENASSLFWTLLASMITSRRILTPSLLRVISTLCSSINQSDCPATSSLFTSKKTLDFNCMFRVCNLGIFLDQIGQFANLDMSFITETLTRQIVASVTTGGTLLADIQYFSGMTGDSLDNLDYYAAGQTIGRLIKVLCDFTINNWAKNSIANQGRIMIGHLISCL